MSTMPKKALFSHTANLIDGASIDIKKRHIRHCLKADPNYGAVSQRRLIYL